MTISKEVVEEFKQFDTTSVSDACDKLGITCGLLDIKPIVQGVTMCGTAFTVHYVPCGEVKGTVGDFLDDVDPGQVVVIDNSGRTYCTVWGDLMSLSASQRGISGTLIDGVCRDVPGIRKLQYPVYSKSHFMVTGKDRVMCDGVNINVAISGVQVKPGDLIIADDTGAMVVPQERAEQVLKVAKEIAEREVLIENEVKKGATLREARAKMGYHSLQTREK